MSLIAEVGLKDKLGEGSCSRHSVNYLIDLNSLPSIQHIQLERVPDLTVHSQEDLTAVLKSVELTAKLFKDIYRKWGPEEKLPLLLHAAEVSTLLMLAGASKDLVVAGALHDICEGYIESDLENLKATIERKFGTDTLKLILSVTEPSKNSEPNNWFVRKLSVLENIRAGNREEAMLSCAAKISTIAAANKFLYKGCPISDWSAGSHEENLLMFVYLRNEYNKKEVHPLLLLQFDFELRRFASWGKTQLAKNIENTIKKELKSQKKLAKASGKELKPRHVKDIRDALKFSAKILNQYTCDWGPEQKLPLFTVAAKSLALFISAGVSKEVMIAGCFQEVGRVFDESSLQRVLAVINKKFGSKAKDLVCQLSNMSSFLRTDSIIDSSNEVLATISKNQAELASLFCVKQIMELAECNKFLKSGFLAEQLMTGNIDSKINCLDNLRALLIEKNVSQVLMDQFDLELQRFKFFVASSTNITISA